MNFKIGTNTLEIIHLNWFFCCFRTKNICRFSFQLQATKDLIFDSNNLEDIFIISLISPTTLMKGYYRR